MKCRVRKTEHFAKVPKGRLKTAHNTAHGLYKSSLSRCFCNQRPPQPHPRRPSTALMVIHGRHCEQEWIQTPRRWRHGRPCTSFIVIARHHAHFKSRAIDQSGFLEMDARCNRQEVVHVAGLIWRIHHWDLADRSDEEVYCTAERASSRARFQIRMEDDLSE